MRQRHHLALGLIAVAVMLLTPVAQAQSVRLLDPGFWQYRYQDSEGTGTLTITYDPNQPVPYILPSYMQMQVTLDYVPSRNLSAGFQRVIVCRGNGIIYDRDSSGNRRVSFSVTGQRMVYTGMLENEFWDTEVSLHVEGAINTLGYGGGTLNSHDVFAPHLGWWQAFPL
jgi:hypothetical protein